MKKNECVYMNRKTNVDRILCTTVASDGIYCLLLILDGNYIIYPYNINNTKCDNLNKSI